LKSEVATRSEALQVLALEEGKVAGVLARTCADIVDGFEAGVLRYGDPLYAIAQAVAPGGERRTR